MAATATAGGDAAPPRRRRRWPWLVLGLVVLLAVWGAACTYSLIKADHRLREGIAQAKEVRSQLSVADLTSGGAAPGLAVATQDFTSAHRDVSSAWLAPFRVLPVVGTQLRSVADLSGAAATVTSAGAATLTTARELLGRPHDTPAQRTAVVGGLAVALAALQRQVDHVDLGPRHGLLASLASKRDTFAADLAKVRSGLTKAEGAAAALSDLFTGPRTYLVLAANNAEMRAGSGMALEAGTLTVHDGSLRLGHFVPTSQLVHTSTRLAPTGDLAARWGFEHPAVDFRDLLLSPQFGPNAALAAEMWKQDTGQHVDGVLLIDIGALQDILQVTGPVSAGGRSIDAGDAAYYLLVQQYAGLVYTENPARHERLGLLAEAAFAKLAEPGTSLPHLATALDSAADGRHVLAWAADPAIERDWVDSGVGGIVGDDDLLLGVLNQGANKLDPYLRVTSRLATAPEGGDTEVTVTVTVRNATPPSVTGYAAGGSDGLPPRQYTGAVALDLPSYAGRVSASGGAYETAGPDYGAGVIAVGVAVADGRSKTVTFRFELLGRHGTLDVLASARIPPTAWSFDGGGTTSTFTDGESHSVSW